MRVALILCGLVLVGCGGGGDDSQTPSVEAPPAPVVDDQAALSWNAPMKRQNGESIAMGDLDFYVIRYGLLPDPEQWTREITVEGASENASPSYTIDNLDAGQWQFTVHVVDTEGRESPPSEVVSKLIDI